MHRGYRRLPRAAYHGLTRNACRTALLLMLASRLGGCDADQVTSAITYSGGSYPDEVRWSLSYSDDTKLNVRVEGSVACPPQWLPVLLAAALPPPPPPSLPPPSPPPLMPPPPMLSPPPKENPTETLNSEQLWIPLSVLLVAAVVLLVLCCRRILRDRADRRAERAERADRADRADRRANRHANRRANRRARRRADRRADDADRRARRHDLQMSSRQVPVQTQADDSVLPDSLPAQHPASLIGARATLPPDSRRTAYSRRVSWSGPLSNRTASLRGPAWSWSSHASFPPGPPSSHASFRTTCGALSNRTTGSRHTSLHSDPLSNRTAGSGLLVHALQAAPDVPGMLAAPLRANGVAPTTLAPSAAPTVEPSPSLRRANLSAPPKRPAQPESASAKRVKKAFTSPWHVYCQEQRPLLMPLGMRNRDRERLLGVLAP